MTATETSDSVIRVTSFTKRYKDHLAVKGVDLVVRKGEMYGLIGPDGAGKSSLMKAIAGVLSFEAGEVEVLGVSVDSERAAEQIKSRLGFMPQGLGLNLYPELSVEENIDFFAKLRLVPGPHLARRKARLLDITRLSPFLSRAMKHLSGGMKQKVGLICALIHEPALVILDEPTTGVDPVSRRDFWAILTELVQQQGMTALVSTAYMDEAARFHRLTFLSNGSVVAAGTPSEVRALVPGTMVTFHASPQVEALARLRKNFVQVEALGPMLRVFAEETDPDCGIQCVERSLNGIRAEDLQADEPELEDVVVGLLLRQARDQGTDTLPLSVPSFSLETKAGRERPQGDALAIEARALVRDFGGFRAVDQVSFQVPQGEIFGLLGANGAGKTTVIKMLTGILTPTAGGGWVAGVDMREGGAIIKERFGYMSQAFSLYLDLTVLENIRLFAGIYGLGNRETAERSDWIITMAGLQGFESSLAGRLPMGVRQRLALGCALVHQPRVLFLDEPTSGVDPVGRRRFWDILSRLARQGGVAILITTHYLSEAEHCDHLALMHASRIVAEGSPAQMKHQVEIEAGGLLEVATDQPGLALTCLHQAGFPNAALYGTRLHLLSTHPDRDEGRVRQLMTASGVAVQSVTLRPLTLEDVFVHYITALERTERPAAREVVE